MAIARLGFWLATARRGNPLDMAPINEPPVDRQTERQGQRLMRPAPPFLLAAALLAVVGIILLIVASGWAWALGIVLVFLAGIPAVVGGCLLGAGAVTRWAARDKPFA